MKKMFRWLLAVIPALMLQSSFATSQSIAAFTAKVVDADTGSPIEGANVVAVYQTLKPSGIHGWTHGEVLEVMETVTGADGTLAFPKVDLTVPHGHELKGDDPKVMIFKPGYERGVVTRFRPGERGILGVAGISGKTVQIRKYREEETRERYFSFYRSLVGWLEPAINECKADRMPKAIIAMDKEYQRIRSINPPVFVDLPDLQMIKNTTTQPINPCPPVPFLLQGGRK